jgi:hypothetical protein
MWSVAAPRQLGKQEAGQALARRISKGRVVFMRGERSVPLQLGRFWRSGRQNQEQKAKTERAKAEGQAASSKLTFVLCSLAFGLWLLVLSA